MYERQGRERSMQKKTIVVTKEGHDPVKKFWKQQSRSS